MSEDDPKSNHRSFLLTDASAPRPPIPRNVRIRLAIYCIIGLVLLAVGYWFSPGGRQSIRMMRVGRWLEAHAESVRQSYKARSDDPWMTPHLGNYTGPCGRNLREDTHGCLIVRYSVFREAWAEDTADELAAILRDIETAEPPTCIAIRVDGRAEHSHWVVETWADGDPATVDDWRNNVNLQVYE